MAMGIGPENPAWRRSPHSSPRQGKPVTWRRRTGHSIERKIKGCAMQRAEIVLSMLGQKAKEDSSFVFDRLYRNLFNPDFYLLAYILTQDLGYILLHSTLAGKTAS
jgi:hypothetical protein